MALVTFLDSGTSYKNYKLLLQKRTRYNKGLVSRIYTLQIYTKSKKTNNSIKEMGITMEQTLIEENTWMANKHRKISFQHH